MGGTNFVKGSSNQLYYDNEEPGILKTIVQRTSQNDLKKERCAHPSYHTPLQLNNNYVKDFSEKIENNPDFVVSIIIGDESWCFTVP